MPFSDELFYAILAMDSYNRTTNPSQRGIDVGASNVGNAAATINSDEVLVSDGSVSDGFFAQAYDVGGRTVISFEGTNDLSTDVISITVVLR
jgi:hypothetical protein